MTSHIPNLRLEQYVIAGVRQQIKNVFALDTKVSVRDDGYEVFSRPQEDTISPTFPYSFMTLDSIAANPDSYRADATANKMIRSQATVDGQPVPIVAAVIPVLMDFTVHYFTDDFNELLEFVSKWYFAAAKSKLDFTLTYSGVPYSIRVEPQKDLNIPRKDTPATTSGYFEYEGLLQVHGYLTSGAAEDNLVIPEFTTIELSVYVQDTKAELGNVNQATLDYEASIIVNTGNNDG